MNCDGSLGSGRPFARATSERTAVSGFSLFCTTVNVPSDCGVSSSRSGRAPEKWLNTNRPPAYRPVNVPVSPSTRRIAADASAPDCRTIICHADSPLALFTWTFHKPAIAGTFAASAGVGVNRFARNGYGAPRVPRRYWPSSTPSVSLASSRVSYSSKLRTRLPFSKLPLVDVSRSTPLKNEPLTSPPLPENSIRNGTSTSLTRTTASHSPLSDCAAAGGTSDASAMTTSDGTTIWRFMKAPQQQKGPESVSPSGPCMSAELKPEPNYVGFPVNAAARRPEATPAGQHEHARQRRTFTTE